MTHKSVIRRGVIAFSILCLAGFAFTIFNPGTYDILIRGAKIIDGTGNPWFYGDIGIEGDVIAAVGDLSEAASVKTIDAQGLIVAPGFIETEMTKETAARIGIPFEDLVKHSVAGIPVGRSGRPEDIANAVAFFADEKSSFVSGQVIYVAGGPKN